MLVYGIRVFVDDLALARRFYGTTLGLALVWDMEAAGAIGFDAGAVLIVEREDPATRAGAALIGRFVGVSLTVEDIHATYDGLRAKGVAFVDPPHQQPWGGTLAHFLDPAGNTLTLLGRS